MRLIDADALKEKVSPLFIDAACRDCPVVRSHVGLANLINEAPTIDAVPVVYGRWEECDYVEPDYHGFGIVRREKAGLRCSECCDCFKKELLWKGNYCPNCGAKMDEVSK